VPHENLYEQGNWPSLFGYGHRTTWRVEREPSWSPVSISVRDFWFNLDENVAIKLIQILDQGYDYSLLGKKIDQTLGAALAQIDFIVEKLG
jgi:hypothetical protein